MLTPAVRLHAAAMLSVRQEIELDHAAVSLNTLGIPMWHAGQSVWFTLTAHPTKRARETSVWILALALVE